MIEPASDGASAALYPARASAWHENFINCLMRAGISGPYILVGHSLGGFVARLYRQEHPADIVGMVLGRCGA